jgi:hypothetical protein
LIRYKVVEYMRGRLPYAVSAERPRQELAEPLIVVQLRTAFVNQGGNGDHYEEGTLTVFIYGLNDAQVIEIGEEIMNMAFHIENMSIVRASRTALESQSQPVGRIDFTINIAN